MGWCLCKTSGRSYTTIVPSLGNRCFVYRRGWFDWRIILFVPDSRDVSAVSLMNNDSVRVTYHTHELPDRFWFKSTALNYSYIRRLIPAMKNDVLSAIAQAHIQAGTSITKAVTLRRCRS